MITVMERDKGKQNSRPRRILGDGLIALVALYTVYLILVMRYRTAVIVEKAGYMDVFRYEMAVCALFLLGALDLRFGFLTRFGGKPVRILGGIVRGGLAVFAVGILLMAAWVIGAGMKSSAGRADYVLVLGKALENGEPTRDLLYRLDAAEAYARENPEATILVTGGNAADGSGTEAEVMRSLLAERGIPAERILLEDKAVDTEENFRNVSAMIDPESSVVLITSDYHMLRASGLARAAGFSALQTLPTRSEPLFFGANVIWEVICETNGILKGKIRF